MFFKDGPLTTCTRVEGLTLFTGEVAFLLFFSSFHGTGRHVEALARSLLARGVASGLFPCRAFRPFSYVGSNRSSLLQQPYTIARSFRMQATSATFRCLPRSLSQS